MTAAPDVDRSAVPTRRCDGPGWTGADGCHYETLPAALAGAAGIGGVDDGIPEDLADALRWASESMDARPALTDFARDTDRRYATLLLELLDAASLIECGVSIRYPWATDAGNAWVAALDAERAAEAAPSAADVSAPADAEEEPVVVDAEYVLRATRRAYAAALARGAASVRFVVTKAVLDALIEHARRGTEDDDEDLAPVYDGPHLLWRCPVTVGDDLPPSGWRIVTDGPR